MNYIRITEENLDREIPILLDRYMRIPRKFVSSMYLDELPRGNTGKIIYTILEGLGNGKTDIEDM